MLQAPEIRAPIAVGLGAIAGALCRYYLERWLMHSLDTTFPIGTLVVNLSGCFLMGSLRTLLVGRFSLSPEFVLLLTTGFLGAYTTFSAYELEAANLFALKELQGDLLYWIGSPLLGFLCFYLGIALVKFARPST